VTTIPPHAVNAARAVVIWALRAVGLALLVVGAYLMIKKVGFGIGTGQIEQAYAVWHDTGEGHSLYRGIGMVIVGVPLALLSRRIANWMVVVPSLDCPACGYHARRSTNGRCPECGLPGVDADTGAEA
jgi:hypothetical protein